MNSWEARLLLRASFYGAIIAVFGLLITAATDEGGLAWSVRVGRTVPVAPLCAALGVFLSLLSVRARGEARALAAIGCAPFRIALVAAAGGLVLCAIAAVPVATRGAIDLSGFYPTAVAVREFRDVGGVFLDVETGAGIGTYGEIVPAHPVLPEAKPAHAEPQARGEAAAMALLLGGGALCLLAARRGVGDAAPAILDVVTVGTYVVASILVFHAVAADLVPALSAALPGAGLLAWSGVAFHRARWAFAEPVALR